MKRIAPKPIFCYNNKEYTIPHCSMVDTPEIPPVAPSTNPTLTPRQRLDTLLIQVNTSQNLPDDLKKSLRERIERLQAEERQNQVDQTQIGQIEREIQDIEGGLRIDLPTTTDPMSELGSAFEGTGLLSGTQGQQAEQAMKQMGKFKKILYGLATALGSLPLIGPMIKDWIKKNLPQPVQQEMEREDLGKKLVKKMKNTLRPVPVLVPPSDNIPRYVERLQQIYNQAPQPKPATFEQFCDQKIGRLRQQFPGRSQYTLDDLVRLAIAESRPRNIQQQREQEQSNTESLEGRKNKAYSLALVNAFNEAAGSTIVTLPPQGTKNNIDYARDIGTLLADALANESYENTLELELDPHLQATDTWNSWYTAGIADYDFLPSNKQPDTSTLYSDLISNPKKAFQTILAINSSPLDTTSRSKINQIQASLHTAQRTMARELRETPQEAAKIKKEQAEAQQAQQAKKKASSSPPPTT